MGSSWYPMIMPRGFLEVGRFTRAVLGKVYYFSSWANSTINWERRLGKAKSRHFLKPGLVAGMVKWILDSVLGASLVVLFCCP